MEPCQLLRRFPRMVFRHGFTFIAVFMLFIYNDDSYIRKRCEQRRAGAYDNIDLPFPRSFTLIIFFPGRKG